MDKREFYKQLMENYTIDTEKIKCNAKRRYRKSTGMLHKWTAGLAACTAVAAVAAVTVVSINNLPRQGVDIVDSDIDAAIERLNAADQRYLELSSTTEYMDIYVSFSKNLSKNEIFMALSAIEDYSDIDVTYFYTEKGKRYDNSENTDGSLLFLGAKITAPTAMYNELRDLRVISYLEPVEGCKYNDDNFLPINTPFEALVTTSPTDQTIQIALPELTPASSEITDTSFPETDVSTEDGSGAVSETTTNMFPGTMPKYDKKMTIPLENISYGTFISEEKLVIINNESVRLYCVRDGELMLETTFYAASAKVSWSNEDNSKLFLTGCDDKGRTKLFYADGESGYLTELDVSALIEGNYELSSVIGNDSGTLMMIKAVSLDKSRIFYAKRNENAMEIILAKEFEYPVSVVSCSNNKVYTFLTYNEEGDKKIHLTAIDTAEGASEEISVLSSSAKFVRNNSLSLAAITDGEYSYILTPAGVLIPLESGEVTFSATDDRMFKCGSKYYLCGDEQLASIPEEEAKQSFSPAHAHDYSKYELTVFDDGTAEIIVAANY